jgi:Domain of unknown function (DUF1905)
VALPAVARGGRRRGPGVHGRAAGFGSVRVQVRIGETVWVTSVFPEKVSGSYLLPVKKAVRAEEGIDDGDRVKVWLSVTS